MLQIMKYILGYSLCLYEIATFSILMKEKERIDKVFRNGISFLGIGIIGIGIMVLIEEICLHHMIGVQKELLFVIAIVIISILNVKILVKQFKWCLKETKEKQCLSNQNKALVKVLSDNKEINKQQRKMGHDFNNHISCIDMLLQMGNIESARKYIEKMNINYKSYYLGINVDHEIADAIINEKYLKAKENNITFQVEGSLAHVAIDTMDLCIILSNSLDNAIEAAVKIEEVDKRYINVKIVNTEQCIKIYIVNSMKDICQKGDVLLTTKVDKVYHGIGVESMKEAALRNGGKISWEYETNTFKLEITLKKIIIKNLET